MFWTLEEGLGEAFDKPTQDAWAETFATVSGIMIEGAAYDAELDEFKVEKLPLLKRILVLATACRPVG